QDMIARVVAGATALALVAAPAAAYDAAAGRQKAEGLCAGCHGPNGNSEIETVPSLAGQPSRFIILALFQFRARHPTNEQMSHSAADLTDDDLGNLAAYYSAQTAAPTKASNTPETAAAGQQLTQAKNCTQCHGPKLTGQEHIPRIAGQSKVYLLAQLRA